MQRCATDPGPVHEGGGDSWPEFSVRRLPGAPGRDRLDTSAYSATPPLRQQVTPSNATARMAVTRTGRIPLFGCAASVGSYGISRLSFTPWASACHLCINSMHAWCPAELARRCLALLELVVDSLEQQRLYDNDLPYNAGQHPYTLGPGSQLQQQHPSDHGPGAGAREALLRVLQLMLHLLDAEEAAAVNTHHPHQHPDQQQGGAALAALVAGLRAAGGPGSGGSGDGWGDGGGSRGPWQGVGQQQQGAAPQLLLLQRLLACVAGGTGGGGATLAPAEQVAVLR